MENENQSKTREQCLLEIERLRHELACSEAASMALRRVMVQTSRERDAFRAVFDESPVAQIWIDRSGRPIQANKSCAALMAGIMPSPDMTVFNDPQLIMLGVPEYFQAALAGQTVRIPRYVYNVSKTHMGAPDVDLTLETLLFPVCGPDGSVDSVMVQHYDLTALARAEEDTARLRAALESRP
ncbi:MAG: hypothetical protein ACLGSA_14735 [Acidobacteriota bacterium]